MRGKQTIPKSGLRIQHYLNEQDVEGLLILMGLLQKNKISETLSIVFKIVALMDKEIKAGAEVSITQEGIKIKKNGGEVQNLLFL